MSAPEKFVPEPFTESPDQSTGEQHDIHIDPAIQKRALARFDYIILPQIMIVSILGYMDRSNLGNARVFGLEEGANLTGHDFNDISTVFYATYITFEVPWTVALKRYGSNKILASLLVGWSAVTIGTGFITSYGQAIACRLLLGVFESGLSPCLAVTMSTIWDRSSVGWRISLLYVANALSGAFGGLIAYAVEEMGDRAGLSAWRWLFIIEGIVSIVIGSIAWFILPKNAEEAWFLNAEQKEVMRARQRLNVDYKGPDEFDWKYVKMAFLDPLLYMGILCSLSSSVALWGYTTFLPTILSGLGFTGVAANYLTVPCYAFAAVCSVGFTLFSDRLKRRGLFLVIAPILAIVGYIVILADALPAAGYAAMFLVAGGIYGYLSLCLTWITNNLAPDYKRAVGVPLFIGLGNIGGIIASNLYPSSDAPRYRMGLSASLAFTVVATLSAGALWFWYSRRDRRKNQMIAQGATDNGHEGDRGIWFRYIH